MSLDSKIVNELFDAINIISQDNVEQSRRDVTIDAEIVALIDASNGTYKVSYQGNTFSAESQDSTVTYNTGEQVYVFVPQGDYSKKKIILGRSAYKNNDTFQDRQDMTNFYVDKGPNWLEWYGIPRDELGICAVPDADKIHLKQPAYFETFNFKRDLPSSRPEYIYYPPHTMEEQEYEQYLAEADEQMARYSKSYNSIKIQASFRTEFSSVHTTGEYALQVVCITNNPKYITDDSHPDFAASHGEEYMKIYNQRQEYWNSKDENRYATDPEYKAEVDKKMYELRAEMDTVSIQSPYQLMPFQLGFKSFSGAPYAYIADTPQKAYFSINSGAIIGLYSISLMQDGMMVADIVPTYHDDGTITYDTRNSVLDRNNIFCKDIDIRFCEKINLNETLYYPWIETPYGDALYYKDESQGRPTGRGQVRLIAHLQHGYKDILDPASCEVIWYRQKSDVTSATPSKEEADDHGNTWWDYGGNGWYPVEKLIEVVEEIDGEPRRNYAINFNELTVDISAVPFKWLYKAVIIYRDTETGAEITRVEAEQEIIRIDSPYDLEIETVVSRDGRDTQLRILNHKKSVYDIDPNTGRNYPEWFGTWWLQLQDDSYTRVSDPFYHGLFRVNDFLLNDVAIFYVQAYDPEQVDPDNTGVAVQQKSEITTLTKVIVTAEEGDLHIDWIGKDTFNYDALGTLKGWEADEDNTLEPEISWAEGTGSDYVITIFGPDGSPLSNRTYYDEQKEQATGTAQNPDNSLMRNIWVDFENVIHFQVAEQYEEDKAMPENNEFTLKMSCVNGKNFEVKKTIFFNKDGAMGTIGGDWTATVRPCNWKHGPDKPEGAFIEAVNYNNPLIINCTGTDLNNPGEMTQDDNYRLFLRPFVAKNNTPLEQLDPFEGYFYKVYWDVRMPGSANDAAKKEEQIIRYASFLRLYHADGTLDNGQVGDLYARDGSFYENGGVSITDAYQVDIDEENLAEQGLMSKVSPNEHTPGGLIAFSLYPSRQYGELQEEFKKENYGAVEVRFFNNMTEKGTGANLSQMMYRFIVKAQVDIMKGQYDQKTKMIQVEGNIERIATITSYYPVDIIFNFDGVNFNDVTEYPEAYEAYKKIAVNWPRYITYNASGYDPSCFDKELYFRFGQDLAAEEVTHWAWNLTPLTQTLEETRLDDGTIIAQRYRPKPHLNMTEGFHGVLITYPGDDIFGNEKHPAPNTLFMRNQVMYLNAYGNVNINGWDGQGIDMNEEEGSIFANMIGAGYKRPSTNAFTGVLIGADSSNPRLRPQEFAKQDESDDKYTTTGYTMAYDEEALKHMPYMTGVFGYQDGIQAFALLENGTGYFGRADRGGRIVFDGANATIYGGGNGKMSSPSIGDSMWNTMRLTLVDLTHATYGSGQNAGGMWQNNQNDEGHNEEDGEDPFGNEKTQGSLMTPVRGFEQGFDGAYFGFNADKHSIDTNKLPYWYAQLWERAYIKRPGQLPYWLTGLNDGETDTDKIYESLNPFPAGYPSTDFPEGDDDNWQIDYFNQNDVTWHQKEWNETGSEQLTGFGPSRASTTPAIEIGQHRTGLMPGLLPWGLYNDIFATLQIPGDRNFMVTYDGTLWAMNGVFMGAVIGSNIIGGRIQGAEIGIGHNPNPDEWVWVMIDGIPAQNLRCNILELKAPSDIERRLNENDTPQEESDYGIGGLGFYVDAQGNVIANSIKIYGGSIDIGRFHILGKASKFEDSGELKSSDYGRLVQIAESDFVGPTHFYGNISVSPFVNVDDFVDHLGDLSIEIDDRERQGNIFQGGGVVALGIPIFETSSQRQASQAWQQIVNNQQLEGIDGDQYYQGYNDQGTVGIIGKSNTIQASSFFAINSYKGGLPEKGKDDTSFKGHFWPLYFHYGETEYSPGYEEIPAEDLPAYVTTMDIFKQTNFTFTQGGNAMPQGASNYFRVGYVGPEAQIMWFRKSWQDQHKTGVPHPDGGAAMGASQEPYLAYLGVTSRAGTGAGGEDQSAVGMTTWYTAPIIFSSDGESAWNTRGHFHFFVKGYGSNANEPYATWDTAAAWSRNTPYGIAISWGANINETATDGSLNKMLARLNQGLFGVGIEKDMGQPDGPVLDGSHIFYCPTIDEMQITAGISINPYMHGQSNKSTGGMTGLWTREGSIHIARFLGENGQHWQDRTHVELFMDETSMIGSAKEGVWFGIQVDPHVHFNKGDPKDVGSMGVDDGSAGIYHTKRVAITSGTTWSKTISDAGGGFGLVAQDKSWMHIGYNAGYLNMEPNKVSFEGTYAEPDNQYHIYARFG